MSSATVIELETWLRQNARVQGDRRGGSNRRRDAAGGGQGGGAPTAAEGEPWLVMNLHRASLLRDWYAGSGDVGKWRAVSDRISDALKHGLSYVCVDPWLDVGATVGFADLLQNADTLYQKQVAEDFE